MYKRSKPILKLWAVFGDEDDGEAASQKAHRLRKSYDSQRQKNLPQKLWSPKRRDIKAMALDLALQASERKESIDLDLQILLADLLDVRGCVLPGVGARLSRPRGRPPNEADARGWALMMDTASYHSGQPLLPVSKMAKNIALITDQDRQSSRDSIRRWRRDPNCLAAMKRHVSEDLLLPFDDDSDGCGDK